MCLCAPTGKEFVFGQRGGSESSSSLPETNAGMTDPPSTLPEASPSLPAVESDQAVVSELEGLTDSQLIEVSTLAVCHSVSCRSDLAGNVCRFPRRRRSYRRADHL